MVNKEEVIKILQSYEDPELGIDVWTLGLVYNIEVVEKKVSILFTFTSPLCPFGPQMVDEIKTLVKDKGAEEVELEITFDPPWEPSSEVREMLGV